MRIFIIGANGRTGSELIDLALARGHRVTAFVRSASKITRVHPMLDVAVGDPTSADSLAGALPGHDAVVSALGIRPRELFGEITLLRRSAHAAVTAMRRAGVRRLALVSAATLFAGGGLVFAAVRLVLRQQIRDLVVTERIVEESGLDWTIARPPKLERTRAESYHAAVRALPPGAWAMSFRAVAAFLLDALEAEAHVGDVVGLAS